MDPYDEALNRLDLLLAEARALDLPEPAAMTLATVDIRGRPSARTVLLKHVDARGLVFFTNFNSRKGRQLLANPNASLCLFWQELMQQVLVDGSTVAVDDAEADRYWRSRARDSQLAAWASHQSEELDARATLERRVAELRRRFDDAPDVPRPPHWSGFRLVPRRLEFWRVGWSRLHERTCYELGEAGWRRFLLNP